MRFVRKPSGGSWFDYPWGVLIGLVMLLALFAAIQVKAWIAAAVGVVLAIALVSFVCNSWKAVRRKG
jgi:hypothetical protein